MKNIKKIFKSKAGMELVQVAILIAIAIALGDYLQNRDYIFCKQNIQST